MVINLGPELSTTLTDLANRQGITPEALALDVLRRQLNQEVWPIQPQDEWERQLFGAAVNCGVSVTDTALSSDGLYD